jgi:uncharacterized SAM-binding protein YcdF (DUF218 family)
MRRIVVQLLLTAIAGYFGVTTLLVTRAMARDERPRVDAIVVLGAAQYEGRPSPIYRARLEHALELYRAGVAPRMVFTGGRGVAGETYSEGGAGRLWALEHGVPDSAILVEEESRNTHQNLRNVAEMLTGRGSTVVLVSDPYHMYRATAQAERVGLRAWSSPTRASPVHNDPVRLASAILREDLAVGAYFLLGRVTW